MKRLVEQTLGDMADQIEESGFAIRYQCEATHTRFIGDSSRMYRVVQNVIENALKYSLKGTRIFLRITEADQNIKLEVINTASYEMNFTEEEIMERFARAEKSRTSEGNGLGLSIADSFTKNCGGEFSIRIDGDQFLVTIQFKQHLDVNKFDKIVKIEKNYVERVENINIKVYTTNCVDNMQIDHLREWFLNPFFS